MIYALLIFCLVLLSVCFFVLFQPKARHYFVWKKAQKVYRKLQDFDDARMILYLKKINPYVFEELVLFSFQKKGYEIYRNKRYSGDGGIDGKVKKDGQTYLIQDKRYKNFVNMKHVRDFDALCEKRHKKGFFVHTGRTGRGSREIAWKSPRIAIISGKNLVDLIRDDNIKIR